MITTILRNDSGYPNKEVAIMASDCNIPPGTWSFNARPFGYPTQGLKGEHEDKECVVNIREDVASTKDNPQEGALKARRARLLERIEETKNLSYEFPNDGNALNDLQDELEAVEAALGYPEPKEPSGA
jgi:hypothetical protein